MPQYVERRRKMGPVGWLVTAAGVLVMPLVTIFLINTMFGTAIQLTEANYLLIFAVYIVVFFVMGAFLMAGRKLG